MKKTLILSTFSPIENFPRALELLGILDIVLDLGHEVDLVVPELAQRVENHMRYDLYGLHRVNLFQVPNARTDALRVGGKFGSLLGKLINRLSPPDGGVFFAFRALPFVPKGKTYDFCVCIANPLSLAYKALGLKRQQRVRKLIVDLGDPYFHDFTSDAHTRKRRFKLWLKERIERKVFEQADHIVIPIRQMLSEFPFLGNNHVVIEQVFPNRSARFAYALDSNAINILYAGSFYRPYRQPEELFEALEWLLQKGLPIRFHYFGNLPANRQWLDKAGVRLKGNMQVHDSINREALLDLMARMDVLVNLLNKGLNQFPSKLIDYKLAGSRILNIGYADSLSKFDLFGDFCLNEATSIAQKLEEMLQKPKPGPQSERASFQQYRQL